MSSSAGSVVRPDPVEESSAADKPRKWKTRHKTLAVPGYCVAGSGRMTSCRSTPAKTPPESNQPLGQCVRSSTFANTASNVRENSDVESRLHRDAPLDPRQAAFSSELTSGLLSWVEAAEPIRCQVLARELRHTGQCPMQKCTRVVVASDSPMFAGEDTSGRNPKWGDLTSRLGVGIRVLPCLPTHPFTKRELCAAHLRQRGAACSAAGGPRLDACIVAHAPARLRPDGLDRLGHGLLELLGGMLHEECEHCLRISL